MPHTRAWDELSPAGTDLASTIDDSMRAMKVDVRERMALEHVWNTSTTNDGKHANISLTVPANTAAIESSTYSLTGSNAQSLVTLSGTWDTSGAPVLIDISVTDTASDAASLLMRIKTAGASTEFSLTKTGILTVSNSLVAPKIHATGGGASGPQFYATPYNPSGVLQLIDFQASLAATWQFVNAAGTTTLLSITDAGAVSICSTLTIGNATLGDATNGVYVAKGLHVGGTSDPGDNNLVVDGTCTFGDGLTKVTIDADGGIVATGVIKAQQFWATSDADGPQFYATPYNPVGSTYYVDFQASSATTWRFLSAAGAAIFTITDVGGLGTVEGAISYSANDGGGAGYRYLRVPNS